MASAASERTTMLAFALCERAGRGARTGIRAAVERWRLLSLLCILVFAFPPMRAYAQAQTSNLRTSVLPREDEDLAKPCEYELVKPSLHATEFRAVFVIFERGRDIQRFFDDPAVRLFAKRHQMAMMMPHHCASKQYEDIDVDPAKGLGRALSKALDEFAGQTGHPELKNIPLVVLGFSGAGSLAGRLAVFAPDRMAAAILANAGQFEPLGLDTIHHTALSLNVPELILVASKDDHVGTSRGFSYFKTNWDQGAPWLFVTQNNVPHCCVVNARDLILQWLGDILEQRLKRNTSSLTPLDRRREYDAYIRTQPTGMLDHWKLPTSGVVEASFGPAESKPPSGMEPAGWLPSKLAADAWKSFVVLPSHPLTSLP